MRCGVLITWLALAAAACGGDRQGEATRARKTVTDLADLAMTVTPTKAVYAVGEPIRLTLRVRNPGNAAVRLRFATGQRYDFAIQSASGDEHWRWSAGRSFTQALGEQIVPPGWELNYNETFVGRLPAGTYRVRGLVTSVGDTLEARVEVVVR